MTVDRSRYEPLIFVRMPADGSVFEVTDFSTDTPTTHIPVVAGFEATEFSTDTPTPPRMFGMLIEEDDWA
jgi:hypothetical protein